LGRAGDDQQFSAPGINDAQGGTTFSDLLNPFVFDRQEVSVLSRAGRGAFPLAEPDRIQRPGSQLPGWRRVSSRLFRADRHGDGQFKVRHRLTSPTIAGDVIRLKGRTGQRLDFANGVSLGASGSALTTRRARPRRAGMCRSPLWSARP
jgi:hypothetical protein